MILEGDQIKIEGGDVENPTENLDQVSPYYLVTDKECTNGTELVLDRVPKNRYNENIAGDIVVYRDTFRIFAHRILHTPVKKSADFEIIVRWRIIFS